MLNELLNQLYKELNFLPINLHEHSITKSTVQKLISFIEETHK